MEVINRSGGLEDPNRVELEEEEIKSTIESNIHANVVVSTS